jgi:hypothetical protein
MIPHLVGFIKSNSDDGLGNSLSPSWATLRQAPFDRLRTQLRLRSGCTQDRLVLNREKRAEKAEYDEPDVAIPSSQWLRLTQVKLCLTRREAQPAYVG